MSYPITIGALGFIGWAVSPYAYLAFMARLVTEKASWIAVCLLALLAGAFGVWALVDAMYIHPDAQGGLAFAVVPLWQWLALLLCSVPIYFINRDR